MKLIYAKGACSLSVHIMLEELGKRYETLQVNLKDKTILEKFNPKGYVPVLVLDDGEVMTEAIAILQYLAESNARYDLLPETGTIEKARCLQWLSFASSELHKGIGPLFQRDKLGDEFLSSLTAKITKRLTYLDEYLSVHRYLMGGDYMICDMYTVAILRIMEHLKIDLKKFPSVSRYKIELENLPVIKKVLEIEKSETEAKAA